MKQVQLTIQIDGRIKAAIEEFCTSRGLKMDHFIEDALIDKLEETEDINKIRKEPTRPLANVLNDLKRDGLL